TLPIRGETPRPHRLDPEPRRKFATRMWVTGSGIGTHRHQLRPEACPGLLLPHGVLDLAHRKQGPRSVFAPFSTAIRKRLGNRSKQAYAGAILHSVGWCDV